jgi:hypothetical protein
MSILIEGRVDAVTVFKRGSLPPETAAATTATTTRKTPAAAGPKLVERGIVDLTFASSSSALRRVLNQIASSPQQFYVIRTLHVRNEKEKGPPREQAAPTGSAAAQPTPAKTPSNTALSFIVGNEHVEAAARIELVRFTY